MRVLVIGAGEVGSYVAGRLSREGNDVVVVDQSRRRLREIDESIDVMTVAARIGIAAIDVCRPLRFSDQARPTAGDFLQELWKSQPKENKQEIEET